MSGTSNTAKGPGAVANVQSELPLQMALRLSKAIGRTPESWLAMQDNYDL